MRKMHAPDNCTRLPRTKMSVATLTSPEVTGETTAGGGWVHETVVGSFSILC